MPFHIVVKKDAKIEDTLKLINKAINIYSRSPFVVELTKQLNPTGNKYDFIKRLFDFVCRNVKYELDIPGHESVWTPEKTLREGRGDCKKMTVLIASVLKAAGIEPVLKHVYYEHENHTHIYVIVPFPTLATYLTVDPVNHCKWNEEVKHRKGSLYFLNGKKMDLHMMGKAPEKWSYKVKSASFNDIISGIDDEVHGLAGTCCVGAKEDVLANAVSGVDTEIFGVDSDMVMYGSEVELMGRRKRGGGSSRKRRSKAEKKAARKERAQKLFKVFKQVNLAPSRASFLLLVRTNIFRLANRMAKVWIQDPTGLKKMWAQFGGKPEALRDAIKAGSWKKYKSQIKGVEEMGDTPISVEGLEEMQTQGIGFPPAIAAAIAAATPIVLAVIKIIGKSKSDSDTEAPGEEEEESTAEILTDAASQSAQNYAQASSDEGEEVEGMGAGTFDVVDMGRRKKKKKKKKGKGYKMSQEDIQTLSTIAEFGTNQILKGKVTKDQINNMRNDPQGTLNTPITSITTYDTPGRSSASVASFGLTQINNYNDLLHWLKGVLMLSLMITAGANIYLINTIILGSFIYLIRKHILLLPKFAKQFYSHKKSRI